MDDMDEVYIPSFNVFLLNQNEIAATTKNAYIKSYQMIHFCPF
jgi:hypothetical protein